MNAQPGRSKKRELSPHHPAVQVVCASQKTRGVSGEAGWQKSSTKTGISFTVNTMLCDMHRAIPKTWEAAESRGSLTVGDKGLADLPRRWLGFANKSRNVTENKRLMRMSSSNPRFARRGLRERKAPGGFFTSPVCCVGTDDIRFFADTSDGELGGDRTWAGSKPRCAL
jgi:hypothetical protein